MQRVLGTAALGVLLLAGLGWLSHAEDVEDAEGPKYTIKEVMQQAHKSKLINKLADGQGTPEEAAQLLELYQALGANEPPQGDLEGWKMKTVVMIEAAQAVVDGEEGAGERLRQAANCAECHREHKPN